MDQLLPGVAPTGRHVRLAFCVVAKFENRLAHPEHIYWDQASLLVRVGLLDPAELPSPAPSRPTTCSTREQPAERTDARRELGRAARDIRPHVSDLPTGTVTFLSTDIDRRTNVRVEGLVEKGIRTSSPQSSGAARSSCGRPQLSRFAEVEDPRSDRAVQARPGRTTSCRRTSRSPGPPAPLVHTEREPDVASEVIELPCR